ncbi:hypothetical protein [Microvirga guangxiensis]|uniref:Transcriptional regulator, TraR/DksA family n=1 Tax=Microvirga guangxiensis TaxID=549386 RepID=A0A1G5KMP9_9HYPH|nr:hypothetical protein [Microvirga guangxiensis]SCZ01471.1 transcriptional regulator, TraR/DksA family [Microvirga guangxiensis]
MNRSPQTQTAAPHTISEQHPNRTDTGTKQGKPPTKNEPTINEQNTDYRRRKLRRAKKDTHKEAQETLTTANTKNHNQTNPADRDSTKKEKTSERPARHRQNKLSTNSEAPHPPSNHAYNAYADQTREQRARKPTQASPKATHQMEAQKNQHRNESEQHEKRPQQP